MAGISLKMKVVSKFDPTPVIRAYDRAESRYLFRAGGATRLTAKRSIRKRKKISEPGKPPSSHTGFLRRGILFGVDKRAGNVVIGPTPFAANVANVLEHGGTVLRRDSRGKQRRVTIRPRPYMQPALEKIAPTLPKMWQNSIK